MYVPLGDSGEKGSGGSRVRLTDVNTRTLSGLNKSLYAISNW